MSLQVPKTLADLEQMIANGVEENISLDYKDARSLINTDGGKKEIAKDVSAMANSAGGIIIYGVKEFDDADKKHLPEKITPVVRADFSKERLEQIITGNISPRIEGLTIFPVQLTNPTEVVYVVEIAQSSTAHQNTRDKLYYKRHNFMSEPMLDYEIRDILNRNTNPKVELEFSIVRNTYLEEPSALDIPIFPGQRRAPRQVTTIHLVAGLVNRGQCYATYVNWYANIPVDILHKEELENGSISELDAFEWYGENTHRDVVDYEHHPFGGTTKYGPSRFDPILPGLRSRSQKIRLKLNPELDKREISWTVHADNAEPRSGQIALTDIPIINKTENE